MGLYALSRYKCINFTLLLGMRSFCVKRSDQARQPRPKTASWVFVDTTRLSNGSLVARWRPSTPLSTRSTSTAFHRVGTSDLYQQHRQKIEEPFGWAKSVGPHGSNCVWRPRQGPRQFPAVMAACKQATETSCCLTKGAKFDPASEAAKNRFQTVATEQLPSVAACYKLLDAQSDSTSGFSASSIASNLPTETSSKTHRAFSLMKTRSKLMCSGSTGK
ncbi:hypothetical protein DSM109990_03449 (plasmid) [Sulfitobacter dubius]|uniref:Transposase DDE domain-containing protein n=1 Tax=Sulfitobacter dubius TaxID=218673 RepID=A0ABY3ZPH7_9RHOB|nr:hypothetical protein DSM109990_03449 [Sulfitobacter dubius]